MSVDVVVVGAGISGLAVAYELAQRGRRVAVLERQVRVGGKALSESVAGFLMEHGPSTLNASSPKALAFLSALGLDEERVDLGPDVRRRYLAKNGRLNGIPLHPFAFLASSYLPLLARVRLAAEPFIPRGDAAQETVAAFSDRRFGPAFTARVIDPLVGGLFSGCADEISMVAAFPRLAALEQHYGSVARGMLHARLAAREMPGRRLFSWREGIGTLPRRLANLLGPAVRTGVAVRAVCANGHGFRIDAGAAGAFDAPAVVVATQPHVAAVLLESSDPAGAEAAASIEAPPVAVVFLGYRRDQVAHPLDGIGYLAARSEGRSLTGALFCSTAFAGRAPPGHVALTGYVGGCRAWELARQHPAELVELTRREFSDLLGARGRPVVARVCQWWQGLPQYRPGHQDCVARLRETEHRRPGLFVTGNYFAGLSVAACLEQAWETSVRVDSFLKRIEDDRRSVPVSARIVCA